MKLTIDEKIALKYWTSPSSNKFYRGIKNIAKNKYFQTTCHEDDNSKKWFKSLENIFLTNNDNTSKYKTIYRADIIENEDRNNLLEKELFDFFCNKFTIGKTFIMNDGICSFSTLKSEANYTAELNDKWKSDRTPVVLYILEKRLSKYLYIAPYSCIEEEEEVLTLGVKRFQVKNIKKFENNYVEIIINEVPIEMN
jgi:hypothetical protein